MTARLDPVSGVPIQIGSPHHEIHEGDAYEVCFANSALADNGSISFHLTNGAVKQMHTVVGIGVGGDALVQIFETPLSATSGTGVTPVNQNRSSSSTSGVTVLRDATIGTDGTVIKQFMIGGGTGGNASGSDSVFVRELVLPVSGVYEYKLTNLGGAAKVASLSVNWYEHADQTVTDTKD